MKRDKISYKIISPSKMEVNFKGKRLIVSGELTTTPAFYADIISIKKWETPYENTSITEDEKNIIINTIAEDSKDKPVKIYFD